MNGKTKKLFLPIVYRYDVVVISSEFLKEISDLPEFSDASWVTINGNFIKGANLVLTTKSFEEIRTNIPYIVAQLSDPLNQHVRVIERIGICFACAKTDKPCQHLGKSISTVSKTFDLDIGKCLEIIAN